MEGFNARLSYQAPQLTQYGRLEALTGSVPCTGDAFKLPPSQIDETGEGSGFIGNPVCEDDI